MTEKHTLFTHLQARAALKGHVLTKLPDGGYMLAKWTHSRHVADLEAVDAILRRMGVK